MIEDKLKKLADALIDLGLQNDAEPQYIRSLESAYNELLRSNERRENISTVLSFKDFKDLVEISDLANSYCAYCGKNLERSNSIQVDRVNNSGPEEYRLYSITNEKAFRNLVFCCRTCNLMKGSLPADEFLKKVYQISERKPHNIEEEKIRFQEEVKRRQAQGQLYQQQQTVMFNDTVPRPKARKPNEE